MCDWSRFQYHMTVCIMILLPCTGAPASPFQAQSPPPPTPPAEGTQQQEPAKPTPPPQVPPAAPLPTLQPGAAFVLEEGTPIKLRIAQTVSSENAQAGQTVDFEVLEDVLVSGIVVVPRGGIAWATITEAQKKRRMGRAGKLNLNIDSVRLVSGERVALRAVRESAGGSNVGKMTGAMVATSLVFFPAAPLFLFAKGKDVTIPKGTEITAYINGNVTLDVARFQTATADPVTPATAILPVDAEVQLEISSTPPGAEIEIDGNFVGNTPSTMTIVAGEHIIVIKKPGFKLYEKRLTVTKGRITLSPELEIEPKPPQ